MERVALNVEGGHFGVADFDAFGVEIVELAANREAVLLLGLRVSVVSVGAKAWGIPVLVSVRETSESKPSAVASLKSRCRRNQRRVELLGEACREP